VEDARGQRLGARLRGPEGYSYTALAALRIAERVLAGEAAAGFQTPATVYGPDLPLELPGVERHDAAP
jgi:short subunit dehydrogenase-like uncharacterized protein